MIGKLGITSIFVTHDQDEAIEVADEIIITNAGRIEQKGTPIGVYRNPETAFTASFFGQPSVLKMRMISIPLLRQKEQTRSLSARNL